MPRIFADAQCSHCLPQLSKAGIKSARALEDSERSLVRSLLGDVDTDKLFVSRTSVRPAPRQDVPVAHPYARGSLQRVGLATGSPQGSLDPQKADEEFALDKFAKTSRAPRQFRWVTWQKMASSRGLASVPWLHPQGRPLPVTGTILRHREGKACSARGAAMALLATAWVLRLPVLGVALADLNMRNLRLRRAGA